jgi:hypothetical protein
LPLSLAAFFLVLVPHVRSAEIEELVKALAPKLDELAATTPESYWGAVTDKACLAQLCDLFWSIEGLKEVHIQLTDTEGKPKEVILSNTEAYQLLDALSTYANDHKAEIYQRKREKNPYARRLEREESVVTTARKQVDRLGQPVLCRLDALLNKAVAGNSQASTYRGQAVQDFTAMISAEIEIQRKMAQDFEARAKIAAQTSDVCDESASILRKWGVLCSGRADALRAQYDYCDPFSTDRVHF